MSFEERRSFLPPGGESWIGFEARLAEAFSLISQEDFDRAVLFSHMGVMRALLPIIAPNDFTREGLTKVEFDNCEAVMLEENAGGIWTRLELYIKLKLFRNKLGQLRLALLLLQRKVWHLGG